MFLTGVPRYFTPDRGLGNARRDVLCIRWDARHTRAILFCNIMLDSSSSTRLDILDVIGSNLLYRPVSTIEACRRQSPCPPSIRPRCIYGMHWNDRYISRHALPYDSYGKYSGPCASANMNA